MEVHHAGERRGEAHAVGDGAVAVQPHHLVLLSHVVQETAIGQGHLLSSGSRSSHEDPLPLYGLLAPTISGI